MSASSSSERQQLSCSSHVGLEYVGLFLAAVGKRSVGALEGNVISAYRSCGDCVVTGWHPLSFPVH